jgi:RNA polymerase sigma factor (sigma-70 family)
MSDYQVRVVIRNNRLLKAIKAKGFNSPTDLARKYKICGSKIIGIISGKIKPLDRNGEIRDYVKDLLDVIDLTVEQAFTERQLQGFKKHRFVFEANETDLLQIISASKKPLEISMMEKDVKNLINNYLSILPERYAKVIKGVAYENRTLDDLGIELNVSKERIRQMYIRGLAKLRTSDNFKKLIESGAIDLFKNTTFSDKKIEINNERNINDK